MTSLTVEFIGIPASGKSFASRAVADDLAGTVPGIRVFGGRYAWWCLLRRRNDGVLKNLLKRLPAPVASPLKMTLMLPEFVRATAENPGWVSRHLAAMARQGYPPDLVHMLAFAFVETLCETQCIRTGLRPGDLVLRDEGLCQRAFSVFGYADELPSTAELDAYLEGIDLPDMLVPMTTDPLVCHERLLQRPFYPILVERRPPGERLDRWRRALLCVERIARVAERRGVCVRPLDGGGRPGGLVAALAEEVAAFARERMDGAAGVGN